jgi:predicted phage terminase large subunit-like protein
MNLETLSRAELEFRARAAVELRRREQAETLSESLIDFVRGAWHVIEPGKKYVHGWHIDAICESLEAVSRGEIRRLIINVPFRTSKSTLTSVLWPAWTWARDPTHQWLCGSYAEKLAIRDNLKMRRLITSPWYRERWGAKFSLAGDQNQKVRFENDKSGYRIAFGMTGGVMGDGGDTVLIDDPHDRNQAHSDAERQTALTTFDEAIVTRLNEPDKSAIVIIMQRLHEKDLTGHLKAQGGWEHLCVPMEYERGLSKSWRGAKIKDPRTEVGELMWPERFPRKTVEELKVSLGSYGASGQLQQRPSPDEGGIIRKGWFKLWPTAAPLPYFDYVVQSWDGAFTEDTANDPTGFHCYGVFRDEKTKRANVILIDRWTEHIESIDLLEEALREYGTEYGSSNPQAALHRPLIGSPIKLGGRKADAVIIEDKGSGITLRQGMRRRGVPAVKYNPGRVGKVERAHFAAPYIENGLFWIPESNKRPGKPMKWAEEFLDQVGVFPNGEHDEDVDCLTQVVRVLVDGNWIKHREEERFEERMLDEDLKRERVSIGNPYAA